MASIKCVYCGTTVTRSNRNQQTCGAKDCDRKRRTKYKRAYLLDPAKREKENARKRTGGHAWRLGPPAYGTHLPGGACVLTIPRFRRVPIDKLSQLHGMVSAIIDDGHPANASNENGFTLVPWDTGIGWAVYSPNPALAAAPRVRDCVLGGQALKVYLGPYARIKAPPTGKRGHQRVRVSTLTPVVITTTGRTRVCRIPSPENIISTLRYTLASRIGVDVRSEDIPMQFVDADTEPAEWAVGGKYGWIHGWMGTIVIETNAVGRWLLECAGRGLGLGGRTSLGAGRVRVELI